MFYHRKPKTNNTENLNHFKCQIIQLLLELAEISSAELLLVPGGTPPPSLGSWLIVEEVSHEKFRSPRCNIMCNHFAVNISSLRSLYSILDQQCIKITLLHLVRLNKLNSFFFLFNKIIYSRGPSFTFDVFKKGEKNGTF